MRKTIPLRASTILVRLPASEKPKLGVYPKNAASLQAFWTFAEAIKYLRENNAPSDEVFWLLTNDQLLGPDEIKEIDADIGNVDQALDLAKEV